MRALVTGAAGFIGGALVVHLVEAGWTVRGLDRQPMPRPAVTGSEEWVEADLLDCDLDAALDGVDVVFHLAGRTGVRASWRDDFGLYLRDNVEATHRLLEAVRHHEVARFVDASSSSVYGDSLAAASTEGVTLERPHSPYGVSKLAAERLCAAFAANFDVPVVILRYFTVFGPGQRPDMAIHRMIDAALTQRPFPLFGSADQIRDFTYVTDVVRATVLAATTELPKATTLNVASGVPLTLQSVLGHIEAITGVSVPVDHRPRQPGDVRRTSADVNLARRLLGWTASMSLRNGLIAQVESHRGEGSR